MATGFNTQVSNGEYRLQFETDNREYYLLMQETARRCVDGKPVTNADRIRAMSDKELSEQLVFMSTSCEFCVKQKKCEEVPDYKYCMEGILDWLQQPAEEADNG